MEGEDPLVQACKARVGQLMHEKYRLDALIGVGGMAAVYMATHRNGSVVAIKLLHDEVARNEEVRQRFLREAYIANKVGHEGTVHVLDDDVDEHGTPFLVMELLHGRPVDALAEAAGGRLPIAQTLDIIDQTLAVLEAAHQNAIIHRDLKPENLMLTDTGAVKVLDFGIARLREDSARRTQTGMVMGTPSFMAPEQATGRMSDVDARTDIYAVGATAFTLLSGRPVHEADTAAEMLVAAATRPARSLARVLPQAPFELVALVDKALCYEHNQRYPSATAFRKALADVARSLAVEAAAGPMPARAGSPRIAGTAVPLAAPAGDPVAQPGPELGLDAYDPADATSAEIAALTEVFTHLGRALVATNQYGKDHPETGRRFDEVFSLLTSALASCQGVLAWNLTPYGFVVAQHLVWEPEPPWNRIPYQLFSDGVRTMGFVPGLSGQEFRTWVDLVTLDPTADLSPEDDMVTRLWDAAFDHAFHRAIDAFAEGNQAQRARYEAERRAVIARAVQREPGELTTAWSAARGTSSGTTAAGRRALSLLGGRGESIDRATAARVHNLERVGETALSDGEAALALDDSTRALLAARLDPDPAGIGERFIRCAADALALVARSGRSQMVSTPLRRAVDGLAQNTPQEAIELLRALHSAIEAQGQPPETTAMLDLLGREVLSGESLHSLLHHTAQLDTGGQGAALSRLLDCAQSQHVSVVVGFLPNSPPGAAREILLDYLKRHAAGQEHEIGAVFAVADLDLALSVLQILAASDSPAAQTALLSASRSPHALVRIQALTHMEGASGLRVQQELRALLGDPDPEVRLAALHAMERHRIIAAGPFLVVRMQQRDFVRLPEGERRQCLKTLQALKAHRCEEVCLKLLSAKSWLRPRNLESTRELAAHFLGEVASTDPAFYALERIAHGHDLRTGKGVRAAAARALGRIVERAEQAEAADHARRARRPQSPVAAGEESRAATGAEARGAIRRPQAPRTAPGSES